MTVVLSVKSSFRKAEQQPMCVDRSAKPQRKEMEFFPIQTLQTTVKKLLTFA